MNDDEWMNNGMIDWMIEWLMISNDGMNDDDRMDGMIEWMNGMEWMNDGME